jgi:hypothetical protein
MNSTNTINVRTVASAAAALAITLSVTLAISWMFMDTVKLARSQQHGVGIGPVAGVSALVR